MCVVRFLFCNKIQNKFIWDILNLNLNFVSDGISIKCFFSVDVHKFVFFINSSLHGPHNEATYYILTIESDG